MGNKFSLPLIIKRIKEFIKDIESCSFRNKIDYLIKIRNIAIPEFHRFLHNNPQMRNTEMKISKIKYMIQWCKENKDTVFTRVDNETVAMESFYNQKMQVPK